MYTYVIIRVNFILKVNPENDFSAKGLSIFIQIHFYFT